MKDAFCYVIINIFTNGRLLSIDFQEDNSLNDIMIIGIAGGTGSGKTTLTKKLVQRFGENVSVIHHDSYYRARHETPFEERCKVNYDHPDAFETDLLIEHIRQLREGKSIECPVYDYSIHDRLIETMTVKPTKVIIIEGILVFENKELCSLMDIKIFVDTDADVRILRRITRDMRDRGRSLESVISQYLTTVKPMHEQFVEPSKKNADVIIPEGGHNRVALEMVIQRVNAFIKENS